MGIYIKGMGMPTRCGRCDMCIIEADGDTDAHKECCITGAIIDDLGEKMEDCPLVSIPPHGGLIDADKIYDAVEQRYRISSGAEHRCERDLLDLICSSPTIIPASEEGV